MLVHESQASPIPAPSLSACEGLEALSQLSSASQTPSPSLSGWPVSAGQLALEPVQFSAMSQVPVEGRQTVVGGARASAGQPLLTPSQLSAMSQTPAAGRQTAVLLA